MSNLKMAVIGTGALGRHHARILSQMAGVELVAVADANAAAAAQVAANCHTSATSDFRELLGQVQAVVVAVPTFAHHAVVAEFLTAGVDVLVEKPIAATVDEARDMVELAKLGSRILAVGHVERFNPALAAAKPFLTAPKYLKIERYAPFSFRSTDIGAVHDLMIHDIDLALSLIDVPVADVQAFGTSILTDREDCVNARLTFVNGAVADLSVNRVSPVVSRTLQAWNAEGCTHIDLQTRDVTHYTKSPRLMYGKSPVDRAREPGADIEKLKQEIFGSFIEVQKPTVAAGDQLTAELASFADAVQTRRPPVVDGTAALAAMEVAQQVLERVAAAPWNLASSSQRRAG
ncbi:MAG: Gfo/Idh/MocA family oxidoreductase [Planctomycetes bacterium]|nr:Gfo/Idh/MocA family oxidoreductase [Planctomycetota bacterium]